MNDLQIENPIKSANYQLSSEQIREHILNVVNKFPNELKVLNDENSKIKILYIPSGATNAIGKDQIIQINIDVLSDSQIALNMEMTNENNKMSSYTEFERGKNSLTMISNLIEKSINKTLLQPAKAQTKSNSGGGVMQIILFIVALIAIIIGLKALFF